jgi:hypothetical protein
LIRAYAFAWFSFRSLRRWNTYPNANKSASNLFRKDATDLIDKQRLENTDSYVGSIPGRSSGVG